LPAQVTEVRRAATHRVACRSQAVTVASTPRREVSNSRALPASGRRGTSASRLEIACACALANRGLVWVML